MSFMQTDVRSWEKKAPALDREEQFKTSTR